MPVWLIARGWKRQNKKQQEGILSLKKDTMQKESGGWERCTDRGRMDEKEKIKAPSVFPSGHGITFLCNSTHTLLTGRAGSECLWVSPSTTEHTCTCPYTPMCASTIMPTEGKLSGCMFILFVCFIGEGGHFVYLHIALEHPELFAHCYVLSSRDSRASTLSPPSSLVVRCWISICDYRCVWTRVLIQQPLLEASDIELRGHFSQAGYMRSCPV